MQFHIGKSALGRRNLVANSALPRTEATHGTTRIDLLCASAHHCSPFNLTTWIEWRRWLSCSRWACVALPRIVHRRGARVAPLPEMISTSSCR